MIGKIIQGFVVGMVIGVLAACASSETRSSSAAEPTGNACSDALSAYSEAPVTKTQVSKSRKAPSKSITRATTR